MPPYPLPPHIRIESEPGPALARFLSAKSYSRIGVLVDDHTHALCYPHLKGVLAAHHVIRTPAGEEYKNLETCAAVWKDLTALAFDRHDLLIVVGGGVLGDLGGFCAATYKRGIDFVLMPTTLLAQVDASVGGKLGIDFLDYKNHIGLFREPVGTLIASAFLTSLPARELRSGFAEVIKHCLLSDRSMWNIIRSTPLNEQNWNALIPHSVAFKYSVVVKDPIETGLRQILNFGHTVGHALESYFLGQGNRIFHGEAVAAGMIAESFIARQKNLLPEGDLDEISHYLIATFGKVPVPAYANLAPILAQDKKNKGDKVYIAAPEGIGRAKWGIEVSAAEIKAALEYYSTG
jgi:3-dehydroquinate synthase